VGSRVAGPEHGGDDAGPALLVQAIQAAAEGDAPIARRITARLLAAFSGTTSGRPSKQRLEPLTSREEDAVLAVVKGRTSSEIAEKPHISLSTVKTHLTRVMRKLGARNRVELVVWVYETERLDS